MQAGLTLQTTSPAPGTCQAPVAPSFRACASASCRTRRRYQRGLHEQTRVPRPLHAASVAGEPLGSIDAPPARPCDDRPGATGWQQLLVEECDGWEGLADVLAVCGHTLLTAATPSLCTTLQRLLRGCQQVSSPCRRYPHLLLGLVSQVCHPENATRSGSAPQRSQDVRTLQLLDDAVYEVHAEHDDWVMLAGEETRDTQQHKVRGAELGDNRLPSPSPVPDPGARPTSLAAAESSPPPAAHRAISLFTATVHQLTAFPANPMPPLHAALLALLLAEAAVCLGLVVGAGSGGGTRRERSGAPAHTMPQVQPWAPSRSPSTALSVRVRAAVLSLIRITVDESSWPAPHPTAVDQPSPDPPGHAGASANRQRGMCSQLAAAAAALAAASVAPVGQVGCIGHKERADAPSPLPGSSEAEAAAWIAPVLRTVYEPGGSAPGKGSALHPSHSSASLAAILWSAAVCRSADPDHADALDDVRWWDALASRLRPTSLTVTQLLDVVAALVSLGLSPPRAWAAHRPARLLRGAARHRALRSQGKLGPHAAALLDPVIWALLDPGGPKPAPLMAPRLSGAQAAHLLALLAQAHVRLHGDVVARFQAALGSPASRLSAPDVAVAMAALAELQCELSAEVTRSLLDQFHDNLGAAGVTDMARLVWALPSVSRPYARWLGKERRELLAALVKHTQPAISQAHEEGAASAPGSDTPSGSLGCAQPSDLVMLATGFAGLEYYPGAAWLRGHRAACITLQDAFSPEARRQLRAAYQAWLLM